MALYVYERSRLAQVPGDYYVEWGAGDSRPMNSDDEYRGYTAYRINANGDIVLEGTQIVVGGEQEGTVYSGVGNPKMIARDIANHKDYHLYSSTGAVRQGPPKSVKGTFIDFVFAEDGTYPNDGVKDDFWFAKKIVATPPTLTSPNGGESWSKQHTITWINSQTGLKYKVELSLNNGQTWQTLLAESAVNATSFTYVFSNIQETNLAKIRVTGLSGNVPTLSAESEGVFAIQHDFAPLAPTNLSPSGIIVNSTITNRLSWSHNGNAQSKADVQWRRQGTTDWTTLVINGSAQETYIMPNVFPNGAIEWRIRTYSQGGLVGPYSAIAVFTSSEPTNAPAIIQPISPVNISRPVVEWTGGAQLSYQIIIEDSLNAVVWDTGEVISTNKARTVGVDLVNGATYKIKVRIKDGGGLFSSISEKTVQVSYTPPAKPLITVNAIGSGVHFDINNPIPTGTQPNVSANELYKRVDNKWIRIAKYLYDKYADYAVASEEVVQYRFRALGQNGTYSESDVIEFIAPKLRGTYLYDVNKPADTIHHYMLDGEGRGDDLQREHAFMQFAGRESPVIQYGKVKNYHLSVSIKLRKDEVGRKRLVQFLNDGSVLLYRDGRGRKFYTTLPIVSMDDVFYGNVVPLNFTKIAFDEEA